MIQDLSIQDPDFSAEGGQVEVKLIRSLALGGKRSAEIQLLLNSQANGKADYESLALTLADLSVPEERARRSFELLSAHQNRLQRRLGRHVGIKTAALDYLENLETALHLQEDEQALTYNQLAQMAFYDHLTGLPNFRAFSSRFSDEMRRAGRYRHLVSLVMLDIDFFKKFNDSFGHPAGNRALEHLAAILSSQVRDTDVVGRYGGEEFALLLPETTKREALELAERVRRAVESSPVDLEEAGPQRLTVSLGLATFPRDARGEEALLAGADAALYQSKKEGRNRVTEFRPDGSIQLRFQPGHPESTQSLHVVGDFNDWERDADPMQRQADNSFSIRLALAPGRYEYKFVVNGEWFVADPNCPDSVDDGYGGRNSVMHVSENPPEA